MVITASFDFEWPDQLITFFNSVKPVSEATTQFLSVDCFIDTRTSNSDPGTIRAFYGKSIILALAPLIVVAVCIVTWSIIFKVQDRNKRIREERIEKELH